jgi:hypothetical protein
VNNTVKRHPRTTSEAFRGADWAGSITTPSGRVIGYRPSRIRLGRRWWHEIAATVALYGSLALAGLLGRLR